MTMEIGLTMKYFILKPRGYDEYAKASRAAMRMYAKVVRKENWKLADDILNWVKQEEKLQT